FRWGGECGPTSKSVAGKCTVGGSGEASADHSGWNADSTHAEAGDFNEDGQGWGPGLCGDRISICARRKDCDSGGNLYTGKDRARAARRTCKGPRRSTDPLHLDDLSERLYGDAGGIG